jgi:hypothetical protein
MSRSLVILLTLARLCFASGDPAWSTESVKAVPLVVASFTLRYSDLPSLRKFRLKPESVPEFANTLIRQAVLGINLEDGIGSLAHMVREIRLANPEANELQFTRFGNQLLILPHLSEAGGSRKRRHLSVPRRRPRHAASPEKGTPKRTSEVFDLKPTSGRSAGFVEFVGWQPSRNFSTDT